MKPLVLALGTLLHVGMITQAHADVEIDVDPGAPFSKADLADAIRLRTIDRTDGSVTVTVHDGEGLTVTVNGQTRSVALRHQDRTSSTRVVALIITSLLDDGRREDTGARGSARDTQVGPERDDESPPPRIDSSMPVVARADVPTRGRGTLLVGTSIHREDAYEDLIPLLNARLSYPLTRYVAGVATIGIGRFENSFVTRSLLVPVRLGIEGRAGAVGLEVGAQRLHYHESMCSTWGSNSSVYGVGRVYLPVSDKVKIVGELGGHYVTSSRPVDCMSAPKYFEYGGWVGAGLEWSR